MARLAGFTAGPGEFMAALGACLALLGPAGSQFNSWFMANAWMVLSWLVIVRVVVVGVGCNRPRHMYAQVTWMADHDTASSISTVNLHL